MSQREEGATTPAASASQTRDSRNRSGKHRRRKHSTNESGSGSSSESTTINVMAAAAGTSQDDSELLQGVQTASPSLVTSAVGDVSGFSARSRKGDMSPTVDTGAPSLRVSANYQHNMSEQQQRQQRGVGARPSPAPASPPAPAAAGSGSASQGVPPSATAATSGAASPVLSPALAAGGVTVSDVLLRMPDKERSMMASWLTAQHLAQVQGTAAAGSCSASASAGSASASSRHYVGSRGGLVSALSTASDATTASRHCNTPVELPSQYQQQQVPFPPSPAHGMMQPPPRAQQGMELQHLSGSAAGSRVAASILGRHGSGAKSSLSPHASASSGAGWMAHHPQHQHASVQSAVSSPITLSPTLDVHRQRGWSTVSHSGRSIQQQLDDVDAGYAAAAASADATGVAPLLAAAGGQGFSGHESASCRQGGNSTISQEGYGPNTWTGGSASQSHHHSHQHQRHYQSSHNHERQQFSRGATAPSPSIMRSSVSRGHGSGSLHAHSESEPAHATVATPVAMVTTRAQGPSTTTPPMFAPFYN